jgi:hypothetical protein
MSTAPLEQFIKKYQTARNYNSKEIRLTISEAEELSTAIALMLASTTGMATRIISLQEQLLAERNEIEVTGGRFA